VSERAFYFDLSSPEAYLAAERVLQTVPQPCEWIPVAMPFDPAFRCAEEASSYREDVARAAEAQGLQPLRWPDPFPFDSELALLAATYAKSIGRIVAYSLAAFRQAFAGGHALDTDHVLIAASACEMHPRAVLKALESRRVREQLDEYTARARA
jgi:2-hydroxychromene-2-carboxylate isomerase